MKKQRQSKKTTTLVDKGSTETLTDKTVEQTTVRKGKKNAKITMWSKNNLKSQSNSYKIMATALTNKIKKLSNTKSSIMAHKIEN